MGLVTWGNRSPFIKGGGVRGGLVRASTSKTLIQQQFRMPNQVPGACWLPTPFSSPKSTLSSLPILDLVRTRGNVCCTGGPLAVSILLAQFF